MTLDVSSLMLSKLVTCESTSTLQEVALKIISEDVGSVLVKKEGDICGIITEKDLLRAILKRMDFSKTQATNIMSSPLDCCEAENTLEECMNIFNNKKRTRLVVKRDGEVVGVMRKKIVERFLHVSKKRSLAKIANTPRFRTGRG
jgi:signal-transduction protein with cAMP-binding, CBS, and nucleotidyltransferase domain